MYKLLLLVFLITYHSATTQSVVRSTNLSLSESNHLLLYAEKQESLDISELAKKANETELILLRIDKEGKPASFVITRKVPRVGHIRSPTIYLE